MREKQLGNFMRIAHGFAFKGEHFSESGKYVILTPGNFHERGGFRARPGKDRSYTARFPERYLLRKGDLIVAMTEQGEGLLGSAALIPENGIYLHNQRIGLASIDPKSGERRYFYYLLNSSPVRQQIRNSSSGTKVRHTSPERICQATAFIPDVGAQRKIAAVLTAYDDLIENNRRRIALLERMAEQLYREWFVRFRFPGYHQAKFEKGMPVGWGRSALGDLGTYLNGYAFKPSDWFVDGIPIVKIKEMSGGVSYETPRNPGDGIPKKYHFGDGEIIFSWSGTLSVLIWDQGQGLLNQHLFKVTPNSEVPKSYLYLSIKTSIPWFESLATGATMQHIKRKELDQVKVPLPPASLLEKFEALAAPMLAAKIELSKANRLLIAARDLLLPRLVSGKLRVDDLDIQFPSSMQAQA